MQPCWRTSWKPIESLAPPVKTPEEIAAEATKAADVALVQKYITHEGDKWLVHAESDGRVLGTHPTKEEAEAQLRAIEANKNKAVEPVVATPAVAVKADDSAGKPAPAPSEIMGGPTESGDNIKDSVAAESPPKVLLSDIAGILAQLNEDKALPQEAKDRAATADGIVQTLQAKLNEFAGSVGAAASQEDITAVISDMEGMVPLVIMGLDNLGQEVSKIASVPGVTEVVGKLVEKILQAVEAVSDTLSSMVDTANDANNGEMAGENKPFAASDEEAAIDGALRDETDYATTSENGGDYATAGKKEFDDVIEKAMGNDQELHQQDVEAAVAASKVALTASNDAKTTDLDLSQGLEQARFHAKIAVDAAEHGNFGQAAYHHMHASNLHYNQATHPKTDADEMQGHMQAMGEHEKAKDLHLAAGRLTDNAIKTYDDVIDKAMNDQALGNITPGNVMTSNDAEEEARLASKHAMEVSNMAKTNGPETNVGHSEAKENAQEAVIAASMSDHGAAAYNHARASDAHYGAAASIDDDQMAAGHWDAVKAHDKAAELHRALSPDLQGASDDENQKAFDAILAKAVGNDHLIEMAMVAA